MGPSAVFGMPNPGVGPAPEPDPEPFDYGAEVERQLRIADGAKHAATMWAEMMRHYAAYAATLRYVPRPRR